MARADAPARRAGAAVVPARGRAKRVVAALAAGAAAGVIAGTATWYANTDHAAPDRSWTTRAQVQEHSPVPAADDRVRAAAATLRESPLYVDPALEYLLPAAERGEVVEALETGPPTFVALMPFVPSDGMGGNAEAAVVALSDEVGLDGRYVVIDQRRDYAAAVDRYGDAVHWPAVSVYDGPLATVLVQMFPPHRSQWIPEDADVD